MAHSIPVRLPVFAAVSILALAVAVPALAQFGPPSTIWGSVTDEQGAVAPGLRVEAYVGSTLCGVGATEYTGDGAARVTVYWVDVVSREQTAGCGADGIEVRVKIGERIAAQTARWRAGPVHLDVTFGNVQPAPIPTFTPTPTRPANTPTPVAQTTAAATQPASSPTTAPTGTASSTAAANLTASAGSGGRGGAEVRPGGLTSSTSSSNVAGDDGFPVWGILLIGAGIVGLGGVAVGALAARRGRDATDSEFP